MLSCIPAVRRSGAVMIAAMSLVALPAAAQETTDGVALAELSVMADAAGPAFGVSAPPGSAADVIEHPVGQIATRIGRDGTIADRAAPNIGSVLLDSPGVTVRSGNGPRDVIVSIRGNNARSTGVIKNTVVLEDGFLLTQPDGAARFDLVDPRAYSRIDVFRGPQSALFGNYATGGALAFRTRTGREIGGYEIGTDAGSFGYLSNYFTVGGVSGPVEISLFASDARANGYQDHSSSDTQTVNLLASYTPTPDNRFTLKVINNQVQADLPARSSLNQFRINPYQRGCAAAAGAAPGCTLTNLFVNGAYGRTVGVTADEGGFGRDDRRTIVGLRWEHDIDAQTTWRTQVSFDERNFDQRLYTAAFEGSGPSIALLSDLSARHTLFGLPARSYLAVSYGAIDTHVTSFNRAPYGGPVPGALVADLTALQSNLGARARTELDFDARWTGILGIGAETTRIAGRNLSYAYSAAGRTTTSIDVDRTLPNVAPELALVYRPNTEWSLHGRLAAGYTTPTASNLFVTASGLPGNNSDLKTQRNVGLDLGFDWVPTETLRIAVTGFHERFRDELVTQSPGAGLPSYIFNAPASLHQGLEVAADWRFAAGWRGTLAYTFDDQVYARYVERLSAGAFSTLLDRAGNRLPGVPVHQILARIGYEQAIGPWAGWGAYAETVFQDGAFVDNANLLRVPGYATANINLHYSQDLTGSYAKRFTFYIEVRNVFDQTYIASAQNISDTISPLSGLQNGAGNLMATTGSIFAGAPRNVIGGMKLIF